MQKNFTLSVLNIIQPKVITVAPDNGERYLSTALYQ